MTAKLTIYISSTSTQYRIIRDNSTGILQKVSQVSVKQLKKWLNWLFSLISGTKGKKTQKTLILETLKSETDATVARSLLRSTPPGAVASWQLWHPECQESCYMLITVDEIVEVKRRLKTIPPSLEKGVDRRTHILAIVWVFQKQNQTTATTYRTWICDLTGKGKDLNASAVELTRFVVKEVLKLPKTSLSWRYRMYHRTWEESFESKSKVIGKPLRLKKIQTIDFDSLN